MALLPNTFTSGTAAKASEVNANFSAIANELAAFPTNAACALKDGAVSTAAKIANGIITPDKFNLTSIPQLKSELIPSDPKDLAPKKYVDDSSTAGFSPTAMTGNSDTNGEVTFPNGLKFKWGKTTVNPGNNDVTFTGLGLTAFTNACFQVVVCNGLTQSSNYWTAGVSNITVNGFRIYEGQMTMTVRFFAIGR